MSEKDGGAAFMTPAQMLDVRDRQLSAEPISDVQRLAADQIALAGSFAAEAFERYPLCDGGAVAALTRSFLLALIDPLHPDLDYLRRRPDLSDQARAARAETTP